MKLEVINKNYCGVIVEITSIKSLEGCDNIQHTNIFGNWVVISKETKVGDVGIYFPAECKLSDEYLKNNNMYRDKTLNIDTTKKGYFEKNGRIRTVKLRGYQSSGLFMPLSSLYYIGTLNLKINDEFNIINDSLICDKYVVIKKEKGLSNQSKQNKKKRKNIVEGQFNFHYDTSQLGKNIHKINYNDIIHISYKLHGASFVSSKVLCEKKLKWYEKILKLIGVNIIDTEYKNIYSSRKVIKNLYDNKNSFYDIDIWGLVNNQIEPYLKNGMSIYGEIVGYLPYTGKAIQKSYDYGCEEKKYQFYVYRITYTGTDGTIYEFTPNQIEIWCKENHINYVPVLYYGYVKDIDKSLINDDTFQDNLLRILIDRYTDKECYMCKNKVPEEGIVIKVDGYNNAYKLKSFKFYERETKELDSGEENIEDAN